MSTPVLKKIYTEKVVPELKKNLGVSNPHNVPTIEKIVISSGIFFLSAAGVKPTERTGQTSSEPVRRRFRRSRATTHKPQEGDKMGHHLVSAERVPCPDFFFEPESFTFRAKKIRQGASPSGIKTKKMGCKFSFQHLFFTGESSNLFYANRNNCKTSPSRPFPSKHVQLVLSILYAAFTAVL